MMELTHGRTAVIHLPRPSHRPGGLRGLSRRFWALFVLGAVLSMFDAFATLGFLAASHWMPVAGHPGLVMRWGEANPIMRASIGVSPLLLPTSHAAAVAVGLAVCWFLTRERAVRFFIRRPLHPLFVRLGAPQGAAMLRLALWIVPLTMVLGFGGLDVHNVLLAGWQVR